MPQVDLQDAIREADENLRRMAEEANSFIPSTTPNSRVTPHQDTQRTPCNALQRLHSGASGNTTPRSFFESMRRRKQSLSPSGNTEDTGGATARSPLDEETEDPLIDMPGIGQTNLNKDLEDSLESDSSVRQWKKNVAEAQGLSFNKTMEQQEDDWGPFSQDEMEDMESGVEKTNRWIRRMQQRKERHEEAAARSRTKSPLSPRSRSSSVERGGARSRNYSGSSTATGYGY